jgi:hypothetical protein
MSFQKIFWILHQGKIYWFRKKYSAEEVKEIASATFKKLNRQRRRAKFRAKKSDEKADAATSEFYKKERDIEN